ncbi:MAG: hypothetical protein KAG96_01190 [Ichthyobacteriaceae bacterium]|nr:hypothetical protein [Ichthyobacteriaceae bacterium]
MKKLLFLVAVLFISVATFGQARSQLNFGFIGVNYEIPITGDITVAPFAGTNYSLNWLTAGVKANYYFDNLMQLPEQFDVYAGANAGYAFGINNSYKNYSKFDIGLQVGARWFWSEKWGVFIEAGGGNLGHNEGIGLTMKF